MINIYTHHDSFKPDEIIIDNESFFNNNVSPRTLGDESLSVMWEIDRARLLDSKTGKMETPYGIASIRDLSTGCKTVLNYIFITEFRNRYPNVKAIDATECGWNAIEKLFSIIEERKDEEIIVVIQHNNDLYECEDREYCINGEEIIYSMYDFHL